jgi:hypothetical protein
MCTVTWLQQPDGYHLLCNRDEKRTRGKATAPRVARCNGVRYIAPIDADCGGTWIAANEFGVTACLLNRGNGAEAGAKSRSRGTIIRYIMWARSVDDCGVLVQRLDLASFAPFVLVFLEPGRPALLAEWNGERLTIEPATASDMPLTSSSYDPAGVRRFRLEEFARRVGAAEQQGPGLLYWFHTSHGSSPDAYAPCMHREDAETVSFSWVIVKRDEIRFLYSPAPPCQWSPSEQQILLRAAK